MKNEADCTHESLYFGSGNYYVFCRECPASWVHRGSGVWPDGGGPVQAQTDQPVSDAASSRHLPGDRAKQEPRCGNVMTGDMGETYVCALHPAHITGAESDHCDDMGLAQWPSSVETAG